MVSMSAPTLGIDEIESIADYSGKTNYPRAIHYEGAITKTFKKYPNRRVEYK